MLRQALALSLVEHVVEDDVKMDERSSTSPMHQNSSDHPEIDYSDSDEVKDTNTALDDYLNMIPSIDYSPSSNESNIDAQDGDSFGEVLAHTVLINLLRCVQFLLESSSKALPIPEIGKQNISRGAIGFSLFNSPEPTNTGKFPSSNAEYSADIISHLLTSICALLADCRQSALESTMIIQRIGQKLRRIILRHFCTNNVLISCWENAKTHHAHDFGIF